MRARQGFCIGDGRRPGYLDLAGRREELIVDSLILILIILLLVFGGGGFYLGRPGYRGAGAGMGNILYIIGAIVLIVIVLRLLRVL
jgi:hypothetical protein